MIITKQLYKSTFKIFLFVSFYSSAQELTTIKEEILIEIEKSSDTFKDIAHNIWELAELGFLEEKSSTLLRKVLKKEGFSITSGVAGMPTAFIAEYGKEGPIIALLSEYDALPGMSQAAVPEKKMLKGKTAGHACGHHLFGAGSLAAAIHIKNWLRDTGTPGTVRLYGTPAEEGGGGKVYMVRAGLFDDASAVLSWHPSDSNSANSDSSLAAVAIRFKFKGIAAHAAGAPWEGRSALDGVETLNYMINMMREHVTPDSRIHYAILDGSKAPNIVPAAAEVAYIVRHPDRTECSNMLDRVINSAKAAAMGTETEVNYEIITGYFNKLPNKTLGQLMHSNLEIVGGVSYTEKEQKFATTIMKTYDFKNLTPESALEIEPYKITEKGHGGSTDVGDISWIRPTTEMGAATWVPGTGAHSWQAVAAGGTSIGEKGMMVAIKTLTLTAIDLFMKPEIIKKADEELIKRRGINFVYKALLGNRNPPLKYRLDKK